MLGLHSRFSSPVAFDRPHGRARYTPAHQRSLPTLLIVTTALANRFMASLRQELED